MKPKILIYDKNATKTQVINTNGNAILDNICVKCNTEEDLSDGNYTLDATFVIDDDKLYEYLEEEAIIKVLMDYDYEVFTISKVTIGTTYVDIVARQITISECLSLHLEDVRPTEVGGQGCLSHLLANVEGRNSEITLTSDISKKGTAYYVDKSLYEAIWDCDNSFINIWGGETLRRQYNVSINVSQGQDRGVLIAEKRNLTGFEKSSNIDELATRIRGKGYNGILGDWQDSDYINNYNSIYYQTFEYSNIRVKDDNYTSDNAEEGYEYYDTEEQAKARLNELAKLEFTNNEVDRIKASYNINFIDLSQTDDYKNYAILERCYLGDTVRVYINKLNIDIKVRIINRKYDVLAQRVTEMELSNYLVAKALSISQIANQLLEAKTTQNSLFEQAKQYSSDLIRNGMANSYVVVKANEILIMDTKDVNTATKVWRWNNNGLGYSSTGYNGTYGTAITKDGKIVADFIQTGILSAITIQNMSGSFVIDLSSNNGCKFFNNTKLAMNIVDNQIKFYNWGKDGDYIGSVGSINRIDETYPTGNPNKPCIGIWNDTDSAISISTAQKNSTTNLNYLSFDYHNITGQGSPIRYGMNVDLNNNKLFLDNSSTDNTCYIQRGILNNNPAVFLASNAFSNGSIHADGDLSCNGNKTCIQQTKHYGKRLFYCLEDAESYLTTRSAKAIKVDKETKQAKITYNDIIKECINLDIDYIIEIHKTSFGDCRILEQTSDYFILESDRDDFEFKYTIVAKRRGYEDRYLDEFKR